MHDFEVERDRTMGPAQLDQHFRERAVIAAHAEAVEKGCPLHRVSQQKRPNCRVSLIHDPFGKRMVVIPNRSDIAVAKRKVLMLESITAPHHAIVQREKVFVVDGAAFDLWQPTGDGVPKENEIGIGYSGPHARIEILYRRFVLFEVGLDDDWHEMARRTWRIPRKPGRIAIRELFYVRRLRLNSGLDQGGNGANAAHLVNILGRQLEIEFFFDCQHEIEMLRRIPRLKVDRKGLRCDAFRRNAEKVGRDAAYLLEDRCQMGSPVTP